MEIAQECSPKHMLITAMQERKVDENTGKPEPPLAVSPVEIP